MTPCDEVTAVLISGRPLSEAQARHAAGCPACLALRDVDALLGRAASAPAPAPSRAVLDAVARDHAPVARPTTRARARLPAAGVLVLAAATAVVKPRPDLADQPAVVVWGLAGLWLAASLTGLWLLLDPTAVGLGRSARVRVAYVLAVVALFEVATWTTTARVASSLVRRGAQAWIAHATCSAVGAAVAGLLAALALRAGRRTAAASPASAGAVAGTAAGVAGALVLHLECGIADALHVGMAHAVPIALGAGVGFLFGRRWLAP